MPKVHGGQSFKPALFPATKYITALLQAYAPELTFDEAEFRAAFKAARTAKFDKAFAGVTKDGASCGQQLVWCLLDIPANCVMPLHAHKNLEVCFMLRGRMLERAVANAELPLARLTGAQELDWFELADAVVEERGWGPGEMLLVNPGSVHQVYTDKAQGALMVMLYSKDCAYVRGTSPQLCRQLLPVTNGGSGTTYTLTPVARSPSSFAARDPRYALFRAGAAAPRPPQSASVAQVIVKALADCGVRDTILYPGAKCIELLKVVDSNTYGVRGWLCRNEHAGAFIAEGYNKSQGERLCAVMTTSGPGATNLCTGIASCFRDGVPLVVVTSQVPTYKTGTAAFQEVNVVDIYKPITKGTFYLSDPTQAYDTIVAACRLAVEGVNGPVVVDVPEDLQARRAKMVALPARTLVAPPPPACPGSPRAGPHSLPLAPQHGDGLGREVLGLRSHVPAPIKQSAVQEVLELLRGAQRPVLLLGGGCTGVDSGLLNELVDVLGMPVVYSFIGKGCISDDHPLCLGPIGVHGLFTANTAISQCDTVLALGCRFDERAACKAFEAWPEPRTVIHVDLVAQKTMSGSPKNPVTLSVVADAEDFCSVLLAHLYGLIEERRRTLSQPLASMTGSAMLNELDCLKDFTVDDDDLEIIKASAQDLVAAEAAAKGKAPPPAANGASDLPETEFSFANGTAAAAAADGVASAASNGASPFASASATPPAAQGGFKSIADMPRDAGWGGYTAWADEMTELKARRWRSAMPCLSAKSELTTREMVHLLDLFLSTKGLQPIVCSDVGSHQCLLAQYLRLHTPRQWLMEGGLASMGCGMPAAIGCALANPQATCLAVAGDGGFAMTSQELMMARVYNLNVKVIVTVNNRLQLVEQLEEETYDSLDVFTFLGDPQHPHRPYPNFAKLADAFGVRALTAWNKQEMLDGLAVMFSTPGPFLLEVVALAERPQIKYWDDSQQ